MNKVFTDNGWTDYIYWQTQDRKTLKKINALLDDISRNGNAGLGKPERLVGIIMMTSKFHGEEILCANRSKEYIMCDERT